MESCNICYETIQNHKLIRSGCCSLSICKDCLEKSKLIKCPQCKKKYFWKEEIFKDSWRQKLEIENLELKEVINQYRQILLNKQNEQRYTKDIKSVILRYNLNLI